MKQHYGIGLEAEGYFTRSDGELVPRLEGEPSTQFVLRRISKDIPGLMDHLGLELPSVVLEVKSSVHSSPAEAVDQVLSIRQEINRILPSGVELRFLPVAPRKYEFIASTPDPESRPAQLIAAWGKTEEGLERLYASAICSLQINDSRAFRSSQSEADRLETARRIHNAFSSRRNLDRLLRLNSGQKGFDGRTRQENYFRLMQAMKGFQFAERGYSLEEIVIPPYFDDAHAMRRWMCAHSGVDDFEDARCKDEHGFTVKIKRGDFYAAETRLFDAVDTRGQMLERLQANSRVLEEAFPEIALR